jgi:hypothetical protein
MGVDDEVARIQEALDVEDLVPAVALTAFDGFSDEARDAVVTRIATRFDPPPSGRVLARLPLVVTDAGRSALVSTYLVNLRSPDPQARRASLEGLSGLGYPGITDVALAALRDESDGVVAAAAQMLVPVAAADRVVAALLAGVRASHAGDAAFHLTVSVLEGHGFGGGTPS